MNEVSCPPRECGQILQHSSASLQASFESCCKLFLTERFIFISRFSHHQVSQYTVCNFPIITFFSRHSKWNVSLFKNVLLLLCSLLLMRLLAFVGSYQTMNISRAYTANIKHEQAFFLLGLPSYVSIFTF